MRNEIKNFSFSAGQVLFSLQGKDQSTPFSGYGIERRRQKEVRAFIPEGGPVLWVCIVRPSPYHTLVSHTLEQDPGCGLVDN